MAVVAPGQTLRRLTLPSDQDASGRTLGAEEIAALREAIESGTLTSTKGRFVRTLEERFARLMGLQHAYACASGTGAIHLAVAAIDPNPGDEIVTSPITDMGAITPILYQGAIPVFADVDPDTLNVTPETIERVLSPRTKAIVVTHLFGNACDMTGIMALANARGIAVIEDCAQAFEAEHAGRKVGTFGSIGCFSLQQGKHITTGEGGLVVTDDAELGRRLFLLVNKAWGYGDAKPDHYFIALNYRMTELQGAVAVAQMDKLDEVVRRRVALADDFTRRIADIAGLRTPRIGPGDEHTYWKYALNVDESVIPGGAVALAKELAGYGIASAPRYIQKPAFDCAVIRDQRTFGSSSWPFTLARPEAVAYGHDRYPGAYSGLERVLVLPWNDRYEDEHVAYIAEHLRSAVSAMREGPC
jgi:dTDP-4-amino-4,6-dideoxygalactose transaminase